MNFLLAIVYNTFLDYKDIINGLQRSEIIKLRPIYEPDEHYHCLVKSATLFNVLTFVLCPVIVLAKSKRLNSIILWIEYIPIFLVLFIWYHLFFLFIPIVIVIGWIIKIKAIFKTREKCIKKLIRVADLCVYLLLSPLICIWFAIPLFIRNIRNSIVHTNLIRIVDVFKDLYSYVNSIMDGSLSATTDR